MEKACPNCSGDLFRLSDDTDQLYAICNSCEKKFTLSWIEADEQ